MTAARMLAETDAMLDALAHRRRTSWIPHKPWPKQKEWIELDVLESCYVEVRVEPANSESRDQAATPSAMASRRARFSTR